MNTDFPYRERVDKESEKGYITSTHNLKYVKTHDFTQVCYFAVYNIFSLLFRFNNMVAVTKGQKDIMA